MALSLLASQTELAAITDLRTAKVWAGVQEAPWTAFSTGLGKIPTLRVLAATPKPTLLTSLRAVRVPATETAQEREFTSVEVTQVALLWRVARQKYGVALTNISNIYYKFTFILCPKQE